MDGALYLLVPHRVGCQVGVRVRQQHMKPQTPKCTQDLRERHKLPLPTVAVQEDRVPKVCGTQRPRYGSGYPGPVPATALGRGSTVPPSLSPSFCRWEGNADLITILSQATQRIPWRNIPMVLEWGLALIPASMVFL